jgi:hypothetical protein
MYAKLCWVCNVNIGEEEDRSAHTCIHAKKNYSEEDSLCKPFFRLNMNKQSDLSLHLPNVCVYICH